MDLAGKRVNASHYLMRTEVLQALRRPGEALKNLRRGLQLAPGNSGIIKLAADIAFEMTSNVDAVNAVQAARIALPEAPDNVSLHQALCEAYLKLNNYEEALLHAEAAIAQKTWSGHLY